MSRDWKIAALSLLAFASIGALARFTAAPPPPPEITAQVAAPVVETCPAIDPPLPPSEPSRNVPTLVAASQSNVDRRIKALASELSKMWTRNPEELVGVIDQASRQAAVSPSVTLLLAIAHAETNGQILDVSEAGAVGLAQATPVACRQERLEGKLFVTSDYLAGSRAYITKKPLGDADTIASLLLTHDDSRTRRRAHRLLDSAIALRLEGVDELELLEPWASDRFAGSIETANRHNLQQLRTLQKLIATGNRHELRIFRDRVRKEYRDLKHTQLASWRRYQLELAARRDEMLESHFGEPASIIKKKLPYEAGEYLAANLDERFSARQMASFLVSHLERKAEEAKKLARADDNVEAMTAALYNGGSHNVKRMLAGLIGSLPETQNYMRKVPATRRRLDRTIAGIPEDNSTPQTR